MVGLGSLGSSVALALVKAGVSRFLLFDPDLLRPENVCRHVGDLADLGRYKVNLVRDRILLRHPSATVQTCSNSPLWDASSGSIVGSKMLSDALESSPTLVVVTVADDRVERRLNHILVDARAPGIYASVLGKGEHGRIFRVIPGETACYQCILYAQATSPSEWPSFQNETGQPVPGQGAYHQPGIPGIGIDIEQVALLTARFALQTLGGMIKDGIGYPDECGDHLLWTNRGGWCFDRPLQVRIERYPKVDDCAVCGSGADAAPLSAEEETRLLDRVRLLQDPTRMVKGRDILETS